MGRSPQRRRHTGHPRDHRDNRNDRRRSTSRDRRYNDDRHRDQYDARRDRDREQDRYNGRRDDRQSSRYDDFRPPRRDRSRERKRSREPDLSPLRDGRRRSRDSYRRDRDKHEEPDKKRRRRDSSLSRSESSRVPAIAAEVKVAEDVKKVEKSDIEKSKAEKLAKVEAWKRKRLLQQSGSSTSPKPVLDSSATTNAPPEAISPATPDPTTNNDASAAIPKNIDLSRPRPKFDHKEIKKRAAEKIQQNKRAILGDDAVLPAQLQEKTNGSTATETNQRPQDGPALKLSNGKISGFGLNTSNSERNQDKAVAEPATAFSEDDGHVERKFKRLPDLLVTAEDNDPAIDKPSDAQDDDFDDDLGSDEEGFEAAREAIQKRAENAEIGQLDSASRDTEMLDVSVLPATTTAGNLVTQKEKADEEEVDPLDAFMDDLTSTIQKSSTTLTTGARHSRGPQLLGSDRNPHEEDEIPSDADPKASLNNSKRNKKEFTQVDHDKIQYAEFRKNFYTESPELAELDKVAVQALRDEMDGIKPDDHSKNVPTPIMSWSQGGFSAQILEILRQQKLQSPTSIQSQALPAIMSGRDFVGIAKTGSGKTLAFLLPMFRHVQDQPRVAAMEGPIGLIMAPTRELALQIFKECKPFLDVAKLRGVCAYGGSPIKDQIAELKRGAEIIVCTPGRMIDLLTANGGRVTNLQRVTYCVLDEADRMFDMGFQPQIDKILGNIRKDRQLVYFSATFSARTEKFANKHMKNRILISVGERSIVAPEITQIVEVRPEETKFNRLLEILGDYFYEDDGRRVVIFVERQETADKLFVDLCQNKYPAVSYHGGREQIDRDQAVSDFKAGHIPILVATSVAARGLDVKQLDLVVQYDCPSHREDYVHRAGRTGRAGSKTGRSITFITPDEERFAEFMIRVLKESNQEIPEALPSMVATWQAKIDAGKGKRLTNGAGFYGRGFEHLEDMRKAERDHERKQYKTGDEPESDDEADSKTDAKKNNQLDEKIAKAAGVVKDRDAKPEQQQQQQQQQQSQSQQPQQQQPNSSDFEAKLNWNFVKHEKPPETNNLDPLAKVQAAARLIASRVGARGAARPGAPIDHRGPDAGAFSATLEVNDFPQKARWAVTNRTNVYKILEATGTSITSKGIYYAPGTEPGPDQEPKLYVLVEGDTELAVKSAMRDLTTHLREGTEQAQEQQARVGGTTGRYNVL